MKSTDDKLTPCEIKVLRKLAKKSNINRDYVLNKFSKKEIRGILRLSKRGLIVGDGESESYTLTITAMDYLDIANLERRRYWTSNIMAVIAIIISALALILTWISQVPPAK